MLMTGRDAYPATYLVLEAWCEKNYQLLIVICHFIWVARLEMLLLQIGDRKSARVTIVCHPAECSMTIER